MSSDFGDRIKALHSTYATNKEAQRSFLAEWSKVCTETVRPVLKIAKENFGSRSISLDIDGGKGDSISLEIRTTPIGKTTKKMIYSPKASSEVIVLTSEIGQDRESYQFPLAMISTDLVESHVEDFLKEALRLKRELSSE